MATLTLTAETETALSIFFDHRLPDRGNSSAIR